MGIEELTKSDQSVQLITKSDQFCFKKYTMHSDWSLSVKPSDWLSKSPTSSWD